MPAQKRKLANITNEEVCFHSIALQEYFIAFLQGKHEDSEYLRKMTYERYEQELKEKNEKKRQNISKASRYI